MINLLQTIEGILEDGFTVCLCYLSIENFTLLFILKGESDCDFEVNGLLVKRCMESNFMLLENYFIVYAHLFLLHASMLKSNIGGLFYPIYSAKIPPRKSHRLSSRSLSELSQLL